MGANRDIDKDSQENILRESLVDKLTKEIEANLNNEQFGVDSLARSVGMSRSNLHRKLNKLLHTSTSRFIREYRLKRALEILRQDNITVSEAAYRVGFSSPTYFNTCFHKFYGITPGEVKSKNNDEFNRLLTGKNDDIAESNVNKNVFWTILLVSALLIGGFYFYYSNSGAIAESNNNEIRIDGKSIVVLPLKNWTGNPDLEYISEGMTDAIISRLTKIDAIDKVIPFTSAVLYKHTQKSIQEIVKELEVTNILQGNLQISGNQIKVNLQLIHGSSNVHLWSEEYTKEWKSDEIFAIQAEVVEAVANNMRATISENELQAIQKVPTKSKQAYSYFLQAEFQKNKANEQSYSNAIDLYEQAIELDSNFVEPYLSLANIWNLGGGVWGFYDKRTAWDNGKALLQKVLEIDPLNRQAEEELYTGYFFYDWNFEVVEEYYQYILDHPFYDRSPVISLDYAIKTGRFKEALNTIEAHILIDPSNVFFPFFKAEALMFLGSKKEAVKMLNDSDLLYSDNWFYLRESAKLYFYLEDYEKSKKHLKKIQTLYTDYPPILMWLNATYAQMDGDSNKKDKYLSELHEKYNAVSSGSPAWFIAMYYCVLKDYEQAFKWLRKSFDRHEVELTWLREEPLLAPVRNDPRYIDLYEKVGFLNIGLPIKTATEIYSPN